MAVLTAARGSHLGLSKHRAAGSWKLKLCGRHAAQHCCQSAQPSSTVGTSASAPLRWLAPKRQSHAALWRYSLSGARAGRWSCWNRNPIPIPVQRFTGNQDGQVALWVHRQVLSCVGWRHSGTEPSSVSTSNSAQLRWLAPQGHRTEHHPVNWPNRT
jgi:hypothetical protein